MAEKDPHAAALLMQGALRLAQALQLRIDAFAARACVEDKLEAETKTIAALARAGHAVGAMVMGAERAEALATRRCADLNPNPVEGDEMDMDGSGPAGRDDPEYAAEVDRRIDLCFGDIAAELEAKGLLGRVVALAEVADRDFVDVPARQASEVA